MSGTRQNIGWTAPPGEVHEALSSLERPVAPTEAYLLAAGRLVLLGGRMNSSPFGAALSASQAVWSWISGISN